MDIVELVFKYFSYWWDDFKSRDVQVIKSIKNERKGVTISVRENKMFIPQPLDNYDLELMLELIHSVIHFLYKNLCIKKLKNHECLRYTANNNFEAKLKLIDHWISTDSFDFLRAEFKFNNGSILGLEEIEP